MTDKFNINYNKKYTLNIHGLLMDLSVPKVMGIINITPDSFHSHSRCCDEKEIVNRFEQMVNEGADIIDIGGCSTRPGSNQPLLEEEWSRVEKALKIIKKFNINIPLSIDTYRSEIAYRSVEEYGVAIINDISGGSIDCKMWETVARLKVPYVLTHMRGEISDMMYKTSYYDVTAEVIKELSWKANELYKSGVCDIIIDPGFGFAKTREQNFKLLAELEEVCRMGMPVLAGISRKSMICKTLDCLPENALNGSVVLNTIALIKGASILRVHDVKEASETIRLLTQIKKSVQ